MKFIKITDEKGYVHYINTRHIVKIVVDKKYTLIYLTGAKSYIVGTELTPEQIFALINS